MLRRSDTKKMSILHGNDLGMEVEDGSSFMEHHGIMDRGPIGIEDVGPGIVALLL
jgi:hypothetical protein